MSSWGTVLLTAAGTGFAGWAIENTLFGPRYSWTWNGVRVPFLPVYAAIALLEPYLREEGWPVRALQGHRSARRARRGWRSET
jgi:hypothetical protein